MAITNLYRFVSNRPENLTDPSGKAFFIPIIIVGGAALFSSGCRKKQRVVEVAARPIRPESPPEGAKPDKCGCNVDLATFKVIDEGYKDSAKHVRFEFKVASGDPKKCVLVNWWDGGSWNLDGTTRHTMDYDQEHLNDTKGTWWVDSVDKDPRYWSPRGINYTKDGGWATDRPGLLEKGLYQVKFKICIYHDADVPKTVSGNAKNGGFINAKAIKCLDWEASILWRDSGITHPRFWHPLSGRK